MGLFSPPKTKINWQNYLAKLPEQYQGTATDIGSNALDNFEEAANGGERPETAALFNGARSSTVRDFNSAVQQRQAQLRRVGAGSSTAAVQSFNHLAGALLGSLATQDANREAALYGRQLQAGQQGVNTTLAMANEATPIVKQTKPGIGYTLVSSALNGMDFGKMGSMIPGLFGPSNAPVGGVGAGNALDAGGVGGPTWDGGAGALGTWIAANAVNYANTKMQTGTGRFMSENDEGHRSDVWLAPGWHLSNLDPGLSRASRLLGEKEWTNTGDPGRAAGDLPREWFNEAAGSMNQAIKLLFSAGTSAAAHLTGRPKSTKEAFLNRDYKLVDAPAGWWLPNSTGKQTISSALGDKREGETSTALIKDLGKLLGLELQHTGPADEFYQHVSKVREVRDAVHEATKAGDVAKAQKLMRDAGSLGDEKLWGQVEKAVREIHQLDRAIEQAKTPKERRELQQQRETALESANTALRPLRKRPAK
jgi:hypothetical protein